MITNNENSTKTFENYWKVYIVIVSTLLLINIILSYFSLDSVSTPIKIFTMAAFLPLPIYLLESLFTRTIFIEIFTEIRSINASLKSSTQEHVLQLSKENVAKIIFVLMLFAVQLAIISVKYFIYESFSVNV
jgi:hypothetical protein